MGTRLRQEIKQGKPFASAEEMVFLNVLRTAEVLLRPEEELLKWADLSFAQYNVLRILRGASADGLACGEIAERMVNRDPDITRLLDRLERRGLVRRSRDTADRRIVLARIGAAGLSLLETLDGPVSKVHRDQLRHMGRSRLAALARLLEAARQPPR